MHTPFTRSWMLLTSFAACVGLATTALAVEPDSWMQLARAGDVRSASDQSGETVQCVYLIRLLKSSTQFRVRAQAAISLALIERSPAARDALAAALRDEHPAVRAAAATSLSRIGDASHVTALRQLANDPEEPVRNAARASVGSIEDMIDETPEAPEAALTAALTASTSANRL